MGGNREMRVYRTFPGWRCTGTPHRKVNGHRNGSPTILNLQNRSLNFPNVSLVSVVFNIVLGFSISGIASSRFLKQRHLLLEPSEGFSGKASAT